MSPIRRHRLFDDEGIEEHPDPDAPVTQEQFDVRIHQILRDVRSLIRWFFYILVVVAALDLAALAISTLGIVNNHHTAEVALRAATRSNRAIRVIQQSRLDNCRAQNLRHSNTVATLTAQIGLVIASTPPARRAVVRAQLTASTKFTKALINALVPHLDCSAVIAPATGLGPRGPTGPTGRVTGTGSTAAHGAS